MSHSDEYEAVLTNCKAFDQPFEKRPTLEVGKNLDFSGLTEVKTLENIKKFDNSIVVLLRHLA